MYKRQVKKVSEFIVTEPVGGVEQDDFLNGCLELETLYTPYELLDFLHKIEPVSYTHLDVYKRQFLLRLKAVLHAA